MQVNVVSLSAEFPNDNPALHLGVIWVCRETTGLAEPERVLDPELMATVHERCRDDDAPEEEEEEEEQLIIEELEPLEAVSVDVEIAALPSTVTISSMPITFEIEAPALAVVAVAAADKPEPDTTIVESRESRVSEIILSGTRDFEAEEAEAAEEMLADTITITTDVVAITPVFEAIAPSDYTPKDSTELPAAPDDAFTMLVCMLADVAIAAGSPHIASILPGLLFDGRLDEPLDSESADRFRANGLLTDANEIAPELLATTVAWRAILRGTSDDFEACGAAMLDEWSSDLLARMLNTPEKTSTLRQDLRSRGVAAFGLAA